MKRLDSVASLSAAVDCLIAVEPRFAPVVARHGLPSLRHREEGLKSLLRIVTDQMISLSAGEAIWSRLAEILDTFEPDRILAQPETALRMLGLSRAKARTFHAAARAFQNRTVLAPTEGLVPEEDITRSLLEIPGIGPWTAQIYLLTVLRSADAWPAADLALQHAAMDLLSLAARPGSAEMARLAEAWRPHRSTAALLLWSHYRGLRGIRQA